jgi:hypothetical protein
MSTLGYGLLPMLLLGFIGIFKSLNNGFGVIIGLLIAVWSSSSAGNIVQVLMHNKDKDRKFLLVYPLFLFYVSFSMIVIF